LLWGAACLSNRNYSCRYIPLLQNLNIKNIRNMHNPIRFASGAVSLKELVSIGFRYALNRRMGGSQRNSGSV